MALHREECVEHRLRTSFEQRLVPELQELVDGDELVVEGDRLGRDGEQARVQVLQQDHVQLANEFRGAIVALHQLLARPLGLRVDQRELAGERVLLVEDEPVLAAAREVMEPDAQLADESLLPRYRARFLRREQARLGDLAP